MSTNKKLALRNVIASILPQAINIISNFIIPPFIITNFGSATNGLVSTIKQAVSYVALVGAGISTAATQALYEPIAKKDDIRVSGMMRSVDRMFRNVGYVYIIIIITLALIYPFFIKSDISYITTAILILVISISGASDFFFAGKYRTLLYADRKMYVQSTIQATGLIAGLISAVVLIACGSNIILVQLAISLLYIVRVIGMHIYIKKYMPQYIQKNVPYVEEAVAKRKDAMLHQFTGLAVTGSQTVILSFIVGLEAASIYAVYNIVFSGLLSICSQISTAMAPFLGREYAIKNYESLNKLFDILEFIFSIGTTFILSVASVMIIPFIKLYTSNMDINYVYPLFGQFFIIVTFFNIIRLPAQQLINVAGHFKETRIRAIIEAVSCVILQIVFVSLFGLYGVLIGVGIALGWRCFDIIIYSNKYILKRKQKTCIRRVTISLIIIATSFGISSIMLPNINTWGQWLIWATIVSILVCILIMIVNLIFERKLIITYIQNFFRRRTKREKNSL